MSFPLSFPVENSPADLKTARDSRSFSLGTRWKSPFFPGYCFGLLVQDQFTGLCDLEAVMLAAMFNNDFPTPPKKIR